MGDSAIYIQERFPDKKDIIASRIAKDADFCAICEDYGECIKAYRYWLRSQEPEAAARVKEYQDLIEALESEVEETLHGPQL